LGSDAIREMLDALLGKDDSTKGLAEAIHTRTSGNPFFTEEVVQNLIETGKLQGTKGAYKLVTPLARLDVPTAVHALLAARIDRLASREKDVLQAASVIGRAFDEPTLAAIVALEPPQLRESLQKLKSAEFVYEQSLYPVTEYLFKHPLTQEVALSSQLQEKRRKLHAAVAQVIEAAHAGDLDNHASLLAHHWEQAGHAVNAATWHRRAAIHIAANNAVEAMRHWHSVRDWADKIPDSALAVELAGEARVLDLEFVWRLGKAVEAEAIFKEAEAWALAHDSKLTLARLHNAFCLVVAQGLGDSRRAIEICEAGLRHANETTDDPTSFMLKFRFGVILSAMGNVRPAREAIEAANAYPLAVKELASDFVSFDVPAYALGHLGVLLSQQGHLENAFDLIRQGIERARRLGAVEPLGWILSFEAEVFLDCGDFERAAIAARACLEIGQRREDPFTITMALSYLSRLSLQGGSMHTALAQAEQALDGVKLYFKHWVPCAMCTLAMIQLAGGQREAAYDLAQEALRIADTQAFYWGGPHPQLTLARIKLADVSSAGQAEAAGWLDQAERMANERGSLVRLPEIWELRAALAHQQGDEAAYEAARREALRLYREMGATGHAERLAKELAS
jgi:tetratricopeptide (TPR) repeat protein